MLTRPSALAAMAGFHSLPWDEEMVMGAEDTEPFCSAAKMHALPLRQPCQATHTWPLESAAAEGKTSAPAAEVIRTTAPGRPFSMGRASNSKSPFSLEDQNTHGLPVLSMAMAGRYTSPPASVIPTGSPH